MAADVSLASTEIGTGQPFSVATETATAAKAVTH